MILSQTHMTLMKPHPLFTKYLITENGDVINKKTNKKLKPKPNQEGYLQVGLYKDKKIHFRSVNRLVMETYCPIENDHLYHAHHENRVRDDNNLKNLKWELIPEHLSEHHKGKVVSEETRRRMSEARKIAGLKPPGTNGMKWWNNGVKSIMSKTHPGEGWVTGRCRPRP